MKNREVFSTPNTKVIKWSTIVVLMASLTLGACALREDVHNAILDVLDTLADQGGFNSRGLNRTRDIRLVIEQAATPSVQAADLGNLVVANAPQKAMF